MQRLLSTAILICDISVAYAQVPTMSTIGPPPAPLNQDPLKTLQSITPRTFDTYYADMLKASKDFGAEPNYYCHNSDDGQKSCGNHIKFNKDGLPAALADFVWQNTGKHNQTVCLYLKLKEQNQVCLRNDGEMWAYDGKMTSHMYRTKW
jgi:hypothetical protein